MYNFLSCSCSLKLILTWIKRSSFESNFHLLVNGLLKIELKIIHTWKYKTFISVILNFSKSFAIGLCFYLLPLLMNSANWLWKSDWKKLFRTDWVNREKQTTKSNSNFRRGSTRKKYITRCQVEMTEIADLFNACIF